MLSSITSIFKLEQCRWSSIAKSLDILIATIADDVNTSLRGDRFDFVFISTFLVCLSLSSPGPAHITQQTSLPSETFWGTNSRDTESDLGCVSLAVWMLGESAQERSSRLAMIPNIYNAPIRKKRPLRSKPSLKAIATTGWKLRRSSPGTDNILSLDS